MADGDVKFRGLDGEWDTWTDQVAGDVIPIAVQEIASTANGSTATVRVID